MENFNEGDLVEVALECDGNLNVPAIHKGSKYVVNLVFKCSGCNNTFIDIGLTLLKPVPHGKCCWCGHKVDILLPLYNVMYFRKIPPPAKEYRVVEVAKELLIEAKELISLTEKIDV